MADVGGRYAKILTNDDGQDVISEISLMDGTEPEFNVDVVSRGYKLEKAEPGWAIGMIRGGDVRASNGFGFEDELSAAGRSDTGVTRLADAKPAEDKSALPAVSHEKQRGLSASMAQSDAASTDQASTDKPAKRRRSSKRKAA